MNCPRKLNEILEPVRLEVESKGFSKSRIYGYELTWRKLEQYLLEKYEGSFAPERGKRFLVEYCSISDYRYQKSHVKIKIRAIFMLCDYYTYGKIHPKRRQMTAFCPTAFETIYEEFISHLHNQGLTESSIECYSFYSKKFLIHLEKVGIFSAVDISKPIVLNYFSFLSNSENGPIQQAKLAHIVSSLRCFFRFLHANGILNSDLSSCIKVKRARTTDGICSAYSQDEVERILNTIDCNTALGKRDYAIFLLAARLGLRSSDIRNLKFENLNWESGAIKLCQMKTKNPIELPLFDELGKAIIDYLRHGRPKNESKFVFLRHTIPIGSLAKTSLSSRFYVYFEKAGISIPNGKQHGPHTLRHSLASALLKDQVPFPIIQKTLGQTHPNTTKVYTKIDIYALKQCALTVPAPSGNFAKTLKGGAGNEN